MKNLLRRKRNLVGWSQRRLAAKSGIERTKLLLFECGHMKPTPAEKQAIEQALSIAIKEHLASVQTLSGSQSEPAQN